MSADREPLWDDEAFLSATRGRPVGRLPAEITGISIDTRTLKPGDAYFAIKGERLDGHDFVSAAMRAGASLAVVAEEKLVALGRISLPMVVVSDVLEAMRQLGMASRARSKAKIIAVTGSVGKTTTKEMLRTVLSACGEVHASAASFNNHWGVPLTLARMPREAQFGIFEIGMNHPDEIRPLVKMVRPHVGMVTNVAAAHLGAFNSIDEIAHAKAEIFEGVVPGGYCLINEDDPRRGILHELAVKAGCEQIAGFGEKAGSAFRLAITESDATGSGLTIEHEGKTLTGRIGVPGRHMAVNAAGVLAAAWLLGADVDKAAEALSQISAGKGRGERHRLKKGRSHFTLVDESYNANPASMRAALETLGRSEVSGKGRRIAVLGDMLELGETSGQLHRELAGPVRDNHIDLVFTVGDDIAILGEELGKPVHGGHFADWESVLAKLSRSLRAGDVIMLKASNGLRFARLADALVEAFKPGEKTGSGGSSGSEG